MLILHHTKNYQNYMAQWPRYHFYDELNRHGCAIEMFDQLKYPSVDEANEALRLRIGQKHYDLFVTTYNEDDLYIDTLKAIKKAGIPTLLLCMDCILIPYVHKNIAKYFDLVWLFNKGTESMFQRWGANIVQQSFAANPYYFKPTVNQTEILSVGFCGNPHGSRAYLINCLTANDVMVHAHSRNVIDSKADMGKQGNQITRMQVINSFIGNMAIRMKYPIGRRLNRGVVVNHFKQHTYDLSNRNLILQDMVEFDDLPDFLSRYALSISFTEAVATGVLRHPVPTIVLRCFEIPMSGGIEFARRTDEIASYFEDGKEIVLFEDEGDMIEKAKFYLQPDKEELRKNIRMAARKRSERDHTWWNRFEIVFSQLGLKY